MQGKYSTLYVSSYWFHWHFNWHLQMRNISNIYVSIWYIYNPSVEISKGGSNSQYSMLSFHKENKDPWKRNSKEYQPTFMLTYFLFIYSFGTCCINGRCSQHYMSDFQIFNWKITLQLLPTFILVLLVIFFGWFMFIGVVKISNMIC